MRSLLAAVPLLLLASTRAAAQTYAGPPHAPREPGAPEAAALAGFGGAIAIAGDAVLVGEPFNQMRSGLVYVYRRQGGAWAEAAKVAAEDAEPGDGFGSALALDGETLLAGAARDDGGRGAAYVFPRDGDAWRQVARLAAFDGSSRDGFGAAIAADGDELSIGAPHAGGSRGDAYRFYRGPGGERIAGVHRVELLDVAGPPHALMQFAITPDGKTLVVSGEPSHQVLVLDIASPMQPRVVASIDLGPQPFDRIITPDGRWAYPGSRAANTVTVIDLEKREVAAVIRGGGLAQPHGAAVSPDGRCVYISNNNLTAPAGSHPSHGAAPVESAGPGTVVVIDTATREIAHVIRVGRNASGIAVGRLR